MLKKKKRKFLLYELVSSETVQSRTLVERALDEESEMQAVYHLQGVQPLPWASVCLSIVYAGSYGSEAQRVSKFFSRPKVKQMHITKKGTSDTALLELRPEANGSLEPETAREVTRRSPSIKAF